MNIHFAELRGVNSRETQQAVHNLRRPESLFGDLLQELEPWIIAANLLAQHLRMARDYSQWSVHFMSHAGGQQTNGRELFILNELILQSNAVCDVVDNDQPTACRSQLIQQGGGGEVYCQIVPTLFVEIAMFGKTLEKLCRYERVRTLAGRFAPAVTREILKSL